MAEPLTTFNGVVIHDDLRFFKGDAPAQQFERGTQQGGHYKCGGCGCKSSMMEDLAHAQECKWHPLSQLQFLVLAGQYGKTAGVLKPFETLSSAQLQKSSNRETYSTMLPTKKTSRLCSLRPYKAHKGCQLS